MNIQAVTTRLLRPPKDDLLSAIRESVDSIEEESVIAVTSKTVSIWQGRCIKKDDVKDKDSLIKEEAEFFLERDVSPGRHVMHTIKNNLLVPSSGIDESNGNGYYILWPEYPEKTAGELRSFIRREYNVQNIGVIITDSHSVPMRRGVIGITLGWSGFSPVHDYRETQDLFGHKLNITQTNVADGLAAAAVLVMGEGNEQTPLAILTDIPFVVFSDDSKQNVKKPYSQYEVDMDEDVYAPFLHSVPWKKEKS